MAFSIILALASGISQVRHKIQQHVQELVLTIYHISYIIITIHLSSGMQIFDIA